LTWEVNLNARASAAPPRLGWSHVANETVLTGDCAAYRCRFARWGRPADGTLQFKCCRPALSSFHTPSGAAFFPLNPVSAVKKLYAPSTGTPSRPASWIAGGRRNHAIFEILSLRLSWRRAPQNCEPRLMLAHDRLPPDRFGAAQTCERSGNKFRVAAAARASWRSPAGRQHAASNSNCVSASIGARTRALATENHLGRNVRVRFWQLSYRCLLQRLPRPRPAQSSLVAGDRDGLCKLCHSSGHDAAGFNGQ
jgi:hypothetical protein